MKDNDIKKNINALIISKDIKLYKDKNENFYLWAKKGKDSSNIAPVYSPQTAKEIKKMVYKKTGSVLNTFQLQEALDIIEIELSDQAKEIEFAKRIYNKNDVYAYELDEEKAVIISDCEIDIAKAHGVYFLHSANYGRQVEPNFDVNYMKLTDYIKKHFNLVNENDVLLLVFYLVTAFLGFAINHPLIVVIGEKGSSKSTFFRMLERLIDPKTTDLISVPKGTDGLELRLANSYFVALDNLSSLTTATSDTIARSLTKGAITKRMLYENTEEIVLDITALVALNGVNLTVKESDLLDRSLIIKLNRISPEDRKTEAKIWDSFEKDRGNILGCIFQIVALVLADTEPINTKKLLRMADFHIASIKVGRALGLTENEVSKVLWENQTIVSQCTLDEDVVASCLIELMNENDYYENSVTGLYCDLLQIADGNGVARSLMPKASNYLSKRLNKIKSSLEEDAKIFYTIKNVGQYKKITLEKKRAKEK